MQDRTSANSKKSSCNARPDHTLGQSRRTDMPNEFARCPLRLQLRPNFSAAANRREVPRATERIAADNTVIQ